MTSVEVIPASVVIVIDADAGGTGQQLGQGLSL
jgi:hypothetical protein